MRDDWPAWATEPVHMVDPDPEWPQRAQQLCADVEPRLRPWLDGQVEHVGSTAVPGLPAKPTIDLLAPVTSVPAAAGADLTLDEGGWQLIPPELDQRPWRRSYVLPQGTTRAAHLHLVEPGHVRWREMLTFRDALRAQPSLAREYAQLKRDLARQHREDREAYTAAKEEFIERVLHSHL